jgi:adenylate cyclase
MLFSRLNVRRVRLASGLVLLLFVAGHLSNLALGLVSVDAMERWRSVLLIPWQTASGQGLLLAAAMVHAGLGLASLASRRSLAMSRTDWVQLLLGLATPPLLVNHVVGLQVTSDLGLGSAPIMGTSSPFTGDTRRSSRCSSFWSS